MCISTNTCHYALRDARGLPMASLVQRIRYPQSVEAVEALPAKCAVQFTLEIGISEGEFEDDSETIVKALSNDSHNTAAFDLILDDVKTLSSNLTKDVQFKHVKRLARYVQTLLVLNLKFE